MVECATAPGFGYVMPLVPTPPFVEMAEVMTRRAVPSFTALVRGCVALAHAIATLHQAGFCYRDLSHTNLMIDPVDGDIRIFDVDNVVPITRSISPTVGGTRGYMPPEALTGRVEPGPRADLHALAVLVFILLANHHPLVGRREFEFPVLDDAGYVDLYGRNARFIFNRKRDENRPDPARHGNAIAYWNIFPDHLKLRFHQAFDDGLFVVSKRVTAASWVSTLQTLADGIHLCPACGAENYDDPLAGASPLCWSCKHPRAERLLLRGAQTRVALHPGRPLVPATTIRPRHLTGATNATGPPLAVVEPAADDPVRLVLRNCADHAWRSVSAGHEAPIMVKPGDRLPLVAGTWVDFGEGGPMEVIH